MKLTQAINWIRDGDQFFFEGTAWHSRVIQWWTKGRFSHVGIAIWIEAAGGRSLWIIEALEGYGVRMYPLHRYLVECARHGEKIHWFPVIDDALDRGKGAAFALAQVGAKYATWQLLPSFGRLTRWTLRKFGYKVVPTINPNQWYCSWLAAETLYQMGYQPAPEDFTPAIECDPSTLALFPCTRNTGVLIDEVAA